ncbi:MAG: hypothetical protein CM1200mP32_13010 [Methanobacteriota archaeon]|jgi:hypothetical protein|nr:MAG: hypothetical protein CM1200mP32_12830 [Euryarchaeota archaeon]GIT11808.1 MAG: hypothetical protein CM1200mP32_13010 [Euryarchaeota archaeon]|tara:strand:- start:68 stop:562 length:495 start_codon:yes stop_codon:yes gene_type:complete
MNMMGFSVCCLCCDEPDVAGSERCRSCIASHSRTRERLSTQATSKADRLAREFVTMLSNPAAHTEDPTHGEMMIHYSSLIDAHQGQAPAKTIEEMVAVFERQRNKRQRSLIRDVANQNEWNDVELDAEQREEMLAKITGERPKHIPSWEELLSEVEELLEGDEG